MDKITHLDFAISTLLRVLIIQERRLSAGFADISFNPIDIETLAFLSRQPGSVAKDIATYLQVSPTTMQSVVNRLEKRGLIARDTNALKGRAVALSLTVQGTEFRDLVQAQNIKNCETMLSAINPLERAQFVDNMVKVAAEFSEEIKPLPAAQPHDGAG
jgi:DNA-binding MarR family transcriptional regulator